MHPGNEYSANMKNLKRIKAKQSESVQQVSWNDGLRSFAGNLLGQFYLDL